MEPHTCHWSAPAILDALGTGVLLLDAAGRVCGLNVAAQELLAHSERSALGSSLASLAGFPPALAAQLSAVRAQSAPRVLRAARIERRHGDSALADIALSPYAGGVLVQLNAVDRPLRAARESAVRAQSESGQSLLRALAHEIKNPLGGLRGAAQLLEAELPEPALREYTAVIIAEADRLRRLIDRLSGPRQLPVLESLNIHRVTERVRQLLAADAPPGVVLLTNYDPSLPPLCGDREWLVQALLNIGLNAVQAVGERGEICLRTRAHHNHTIDSVRHRLVVEVAIEDDGPGVSEGMRERLFLPMATDRSGGSGLGLGIAHALVTRLNGTIEWRSRPGQTVFSVFLVAGPST